MKAYRQLYDRVPSDLRIIDQEWVLVNGARVHISDLEHLTELLNQEYQKSKKATLVKRLVRWLKQA